MLARALLFGLLALLLVAGPAAADWDCEKCCDEITQCRSAKSSLSDNEHKRCSSTLMTTSGSSLDSACAHLCESDSFESVCMRLIADSDDNIECHKILDPKNCDKHVNEDNEQICFWVGGPCIEREGEKDEDDDN
eukprot:gnl/Hemi2/5795_TR1999_c0_g1_i1.p1 gnl/Hemi2/5795_TR1999_c0_g1~~gnl/Hemi2/5795_TR1999_c0_g1_i1.p1  ORF type:complete len:135 (-),score=20.73 gnl/Hemi2/5795_TR1999_c0_g1_i1:70-474(-)